MAEARSRHPEIEIDGEFIAERAGQALVNASNTASMVAVGSRGHGARWPSSADTFVASGHAQQASKRRTSRATSTSSAAVTTTVCTVAPMVEMSASSAAWLAAASISTPK